MQKFYILKFKNGNLRNLENETFIIIICKTFACNGSLSLNFLEIFYNKINFMNVPSSVFHEFCLPTNVN